MTKQFLKLSGLQAAHINRGDQVRSQKLSQHVRIDFVTLDSGRRNGLGLHGIGDDYLDSLSRQEIVKPVPGPHGFNDHFGPVPEILKMFEDDRLFIGKIGLGNDFTHLINRGDKRCFLVGDRTCAILG
jgi:hypothetical protein